MSTWRIIQSFFLPALVLLGIPWFIHEWLDPLQFRNAFSFISGILLLLTGVGFLAWTSVLFVSFGEGTIAPWDAPAKLVVLGPYRYVRNPMVIAMITALWGEALLFTSFYILYLSLLYWLIHHLWFVYFEEPRLLKHFGDAYRRYKDEVPRWISLDKPIEFDP